MSRLFDLGSCIATPIDTTKSTIKMNRVKFSDDNVIQLEKEIDKMDEVLPPLKNFILPSGNRASVSLHLSRTIARRSERLIVPLVRNGSVDSVVQRYLNRLSDFLFVSARYITVKENLKEIIWKKHM